MVDATHHIAVRPYGNAGWKLHLTPDQPEQRGRMGLGRLVFYCVPICRRRVDGTLQKGAGRTMHRIDGGHESPTPWREAFANARELGLPETYLCADCEKLGAIAEVGDA